MKGASTNQTTVADWFTRWPNSNIGIATGAASGFIVIDIDGPKGMQSLDNLRLLYGELPATIEQKTGSGGRHLLFKYPGPGIKNKVNIAPGIDIRADGGYIVAAPSLHISGGRYEWIMGRMPGEIQLAELPPWWLGFLTGENERTTLPQAFQIDGGTIPEGSRNQTLFKTACSLRAKGLTESAIFSALCEVNDKQCIPPLDSNELRVIFDSAMKYEPGQMQIATSAKIDFSTPMAATRIICLDNVAAEAVNWLWFPYIPLGKLTLIQGDPGDGKTTVVLNIAANISMGRPLPGAGATQPGNVIYQTAEDGIADTIKPRLMSAVADCKRVFVIDESEKGLSLSDERIEAAIIQLRPKLFIIDPLQAYLGADTDMHRANEVRPILKKIGFLAEKYGCSIVMIMHLSKASQNRSLYRGLGSIDIPAAARSVLLVGKNPSNPQERAMAQVKNSLAQMGPSLGFEITEFGVSWKGESILTAEDMLGSASKSENEEDKAPIREARKFLIDSLRDGPRAAKEILESVKFMGFSTATLKRAKMALKIQSYKEGDSWLWGFPPDMTFEEDQILE